MQPYYEVDISRPWHWGIAVVSGSGAVVPETLSTSLVTATPDALVIKVRHAQDVDADTVSGDEVGGDTGWAVARVRVRHVADLEAPANQANQVEQVDQAGQAGQAGQADSAERAESVEPVVFECVLRCPGGRLTIGDADGGVTVDGLTDPSRVRVSAHGADATGPTDVRVDLAPAKGP